MAITGQQRKALHKYCEQIAETLNDAGIDMRTFFKPGFDIPWNKDNIKNSVWRSVQTAIYPDVESTEDLENHQITKIYDILNKHLGEKHGVHVPWPCKDDQENAA